MSLFTDIRRVNNAANEGVPPANDAEAWSTGDAVDLNAQGDQTIDLQKIDAATELTVLVEFSAAGSVEVHFLDGDGNRIVSRTSSENGDYNVSGAGDVFVTTSAATPYVEVDIIEDSGGANSASWGVYLR